MLEKVGLKSSILLYDVRKSLSTNHLLIAKVQGITNSLPQRQQEAKLQRWHELNIRITKSLNYMALQQNMTTSGSTRLLPRSRSYPGTGFLTLYQISNKTLKSYKYTLKHVWFTH